MFLLCAAILLTGAAAQSSVMTSYKETLQNITPQVEVGFSSAENSDPLSVSFAANEKTDLVAHYSSRDLWVKLKVVNQSATPLRKLLYFTSPLAGTLTLYRESDRSTTRSGPGLPLTQRAVPVRLGGFELNLNPQEEALYYMKRSSHHALSSQLFLADPVAAEKMESQARSIFFFYLGGILSLVLYNFSLGLFTTQKDHLIYALFAGSFGITTMALHGVLDTYLFANSRIVFSNYLMFFSSLSLFSASLFVQRFLSVGRNFAIGFWGLRLIMGLSLVSLVASFFAADYHNLSFFGYWIDLCIGGGILFFIYCGAHALLKRQLTLAYYFFISWLVILIGTFIWMAALHGFIESSIFTQYSLLFANLGEMLVLSLGLAYKIKVLDREKRAALAAAEDKERYHRLVRVLSHDVANAVGSLLHHTEHLSLMNTQDSLKDSISRLAKSAHRIDKVLKGVRQEEILHSFKAHTEFRPLDLLSACTEAVRHYSWDANDKKIVIHNNVPAGVLVKADRTALVNQVLSNLLSNSIKFSEPGSNIFLDLTKSEKEFHLHIKDEGVGIPPELIQNIFYNTKKVFSEPGTANEKGTGLGSILVGEYMKLFNGRIDVQSTHISQGPKTGTTVSLIFPIVSTGSANEV